MGAIIIDSDELQSAEVLEIFDEFEEITGDEEFSITYDTEQGFSIDK